MAVFAVCLFVVLASLHRCTPGSAGIAFATEQAEEEKTGGTRTQARDEIILESHGTGGGTLVFSPDGKTLITGGHGKGVFSTGVVKLWNVATWKERETLKMQSLSLCSLAISPDGNKMATGGGHPIPTGATPGGVILWDLMAGKQQERFSEGSPIYSVAFSFDGKTLAGGGYKILILWDVGTQKVRARLKVPRPTIKAVAFSPDNKLLATGGSQGRESDRRDEGVVQLWDVATGKELAVLEGHRYYVNTLTFSPDGKTLAVGGGGQKHPELKLWDVANKKERVSLQGHNEWINAVAFSPDGKILASAGQDQTVKLWDVETGREGVTFRGHTSAVLSVAFSPDGRTLASATNETVRIRRLSK